MRYQFNPIAKCAFSEMFIEYGNVEVYKYQYFVVIILTHGPGMRELFEVVQHFVELLIILEIKVGA